MFKACGIIPHMSPLQVKNLLMDSTQVERYNKYTVGRKDLCTFHNDQTIVVEGGAKVPFTGKVIKTQILMHSRSISFHKNSNANDNRNDNGFLIVSRSVVPRTEATGAKKHASPGDRNEVFWGINILRAVPGHENKTLLTNVTQVNSSVLPSFLAHKVGLTCAADFIKNLRAA